MMLKIAVVALAVLLVFGVYVPGTGNVSATEDVEAREEMAQDKEKMDAEDVRELLYEERDMQDNPYYEEQRHEEEKDNADDKDQDDHGKK